MRAYIACILGFLLAAHAQRPSPLTGDLNAHDPVIIKTAGGYFVFHTGNGVSMKTSSDRIAWKNAGRVFAESPAWHKQYVPNATAHLWAPDISFRDGKYRLYYSISTFGSQVSAIGLATTDTLLAASGATRWTDQGMVVRSTAADGFNAIDPNAYTEADGSCWLTFGSFWNGIQLLRLDPATGKPAPGAVPATIASRRSGIEAPFLFRKGGYHWLFVSFDLCCQGAASTYNIRAGRSASVTGPFVDSEGLSLRNGGGLLIDSGDARWKGPGHNAVFTDHDTVFLVNHAYDAENNGASRLQIRPLYWTSAGWPSLDPAVGQTGLWRKPRPESKPGSSFTCNLLGRRVSKPAAASSGRIPELRR